jgi:hypothetical protein
MRYYMKVLHEGIYIYNAKFSVRYEIFETIDRLYI